MKVKFIFTVSEADNPEAPSKLVLTTYQKIIELSIIPRCGERIVVAGRSAVVCPRADDIEWGIFDPKYTLSQDIIVSMSIPRPIISAEKSAIEEAGFEVVSS